VRKLIGNLLTRN